MTTEVTSTLEAMTRRPRNVIELILTVDGDKISAKVNEIADRGAKTDVGGEVDGKVELVDPLRREMITLFQEWLSESRVQKRKELEVLGTILFQALFNGPILGLFEKHLDKTQESGSQFRVQLRFKNAPSLANLPWEYMYYIPQGGRSFFLSTAVELNLSRFMQPPAGRGLLEPDESTLRLLVVVSAPDDPDLGPVAAKPIIEAIEGLAADQPIQIEILKKPTVHSFVEKLETSKPHVLHFIGHGRFNQKEGKGEIALLNFDEKTTRWVQDSDFAEYFSNTKAVPRLVFLHVCESGVVKFESGFAGLAPKLIESGVPMVVAMQHPISNEAAISFGKTFYRQLAKGECVDRAVQQGRYAITVDDPRAYNDRVFGTPVLYLCSYNSLILPEKDPDTEQKGEGEKSQSKSSRSIDAPSDALPSQGTTPSQPGSSPQQPVPSQPPSPMPGLTSEQQHGDAPSSNVKPVRPVELKSGYLSRDVNAQALIPAELIVKMREEGLNAGKGAGFDIDHVKKTITSLDFKVRTGAMQEELDRRIREGQEMEMDCVYNAMLTVLKRS